MSAWQVVLSLGVLLQVIGYGLAIKSWADVRRAFFPTSPGPYGRLRAWFSRTVLRREAPTQVVPVDIVAASGAVPNPTISVRPPRPADDASEGEFRQYVREYLTQVDCDLANRAAAIDRRIEDLGKELGTKLNQVEGSLAEQVESLHGQVRQATGATDERTLYGALWALLSVVLGSLLAGLAAVFG